MAVAASGAPQFPVGEKQLKIFSCLRERNTWFYYEHQEKQQKVERYVQKALTAVESVLP